MYSIATIQKKQSELVNRILEKAQEQAIINGAFTDQGGKIAIKVDLSVSGIATIYKNAIEESGEWKYIGHTNDTDDTNVKIVTIDRA